MQYRTLPNSDVTVSEVGFGLWTTSTGWWGEKTDAEAVALLHEALDLGITMFDAADTYGDGRSETQLAAAFGGRRERVVYATKFGYDWEGHSGDRKGQNEIEQDFSPAHVRRALEGSLRRLGTDYIDVWQMHNARMDQVRDGELQALLETFRTEGKIRTWGISAKSPVEGIEGLALGAPVIQANFNMMDVRAVTSGLLDDVARRQAGFIGRTPLCFGFLSGAIRRDTVFPPGDHRLGWERAQLDNWIDGASELLAAVHAAPGAEGARSALRFCLAFEGLATTIPGILTPSEAEENARASDLGPLPSGAVEAVLQINRQRDFFVARARAS